MGRSPIAFLAAWTAMTAAMMLSPLAWFAYGYAAAIRRDGCAVAVRAARTASLTCGYALVWLLAGAGALALASAADELARAWPHGVPWAGGLALAAAGVYQLSPLKQRCLARCRSPLSFALMASGLRGPLRDLHVAPGLQGARMS